MRVAADDADQPAFQLPPSVPQLRALIHRLTDEHILAIEVQLAARATVERCDDDLRKAQRQLEVVSATLAGIAARQKAAIERLVRLRLDLPVDEPDDADDLPF